MVSCCQHPNNVPRFKTNIITNMELAGNTKYLTHIKDSRHVTSSSIVEQFLAKFLH